MGDERDEPSDEMRSEIDTLLDPAYAEQERAQHVQLLERVLAGLEAIEVAETDIDRVAALEALPAATGDDAELDALLGHLKSSSIYVSDFGMTLKVAIGRATYVRQLVAPTRLRTKLPRLKAASSDGGSGGDAEEPAAPSDGDRPAKLKKVKKVRKRRRPASGDG